MCDTPCVVDGPFQEEIYSKLEESNVQGSRIQGTTDILVGDSAVKASVQFAVVKEINGGEETYERLSTLEGSMGLGLGQVVSHKYTSPTLQLVQESEAAWELPVVSFYISPRSGKTGQVLFGGIDQDLIVGKKLHYVSLSEKQTVDNVEWKIDVSKVVYGGDIAVEGTVAVVATSAPALYLPTSIFEEITIDSYSEFGCDVPRIGYLNKCIAPCSKLSGVYDIDFVINRKRYTIEVADYSEKVPFELTKGEPPQCALSIQDSGSETEFTLGHPFFKKYYTAFHYGKSKKKGGARGKPKIGFALAKESGEEVEKKKKKKMKKKPKYTRITMDGDKIKWHR